MSAKREGDVAKLHQRADADGAFLHVRGEFEALGRLREQLAEV